MELLTHEIASLMTPRWTAAELEDWQDMGGVVIGLERITML